MVSQSTMKYTSLYSIERYSCMNDETQTKSLWKSLKMRCNVTRTKSKGLANVLDYLYWSIWSPQLSPRRRSLFVILYHPNGLENIFNGPFPPPLLKNCTAEKNNHKVTEAEECSQDCLVRRASSFVKMKNFE